MGRESIARSAQLLYVGRTDAEFEKVWEQYRHEGQAVEQASTPQQALEALESVAARVVVINLLGEGPSADRLRRSLSRRIPVVRRLVLADHRLPLMAGEECLLWPFTLRKMRLSLNRLLREAVPEIISVDPLQLDLSARRVSGPRGVHHLTPKQCSLLAFFMRHPNQVLSRKDLMELVWETVYLGDTRTLDVHIRWLREKIEADPQNPVFLVTRRRVGYMFSPSSVAVLPSVAPQQQAA